MLMAPFSIDPRSAGVNHTTSALAVPEMVSVNGYGSLATIKLADNAPVAVLNITGAVLSRLLVIVNSVSLSTVST